MLGSRPDPECLGYASSHDAQGGEDVTPTRWCAWGLSLNSRCTCLAGCSAPPLTGLSFLNSLCLRLPGSKMRMMKVYTSKVNANMKQDNLSNAQHLPGKQEVPSECCWSEKASLRNEWLEFHSF